MREAYERRFFDGDQVIIRHSFRALHERNIGILTGSILQRDMVVVDDENSLTRCAISSTVLDSERSAIDA